MAIFLDNPRHPPLIQAVREVTVEIPLERSTEVQRFYCELLELRPWAAERQRPGGWGAGPQRCGVYFQFRHDPDVNPAKRRLSLVVAHLEEVEAVLVGAGYAVSRSQSFGFGEQLLHVTDPAGHWIELRQLRPL